MHLISVRPEIPSGRPEIRGGRKIRTSSMHSQSLRQRRRRVALDQNQSSAVPRSESGAPSTPRREQPSEGARPYSEGARRSRQLKTTDLIPKRWWALAGLLVVLAIVIAVLNVMHFHAPALAESIGQQGVAALSLDGRHGIGAWYCNFMLILTSCVSLQLFLLRQHRRDDYRGAYRVWLWGAGICLLASVVTVSNVPNLIGNLCATVTGSPGNSVWIIVLKLAALSLLIVRGIVEVRHSRVALVGLIMVFCAYGLATLVHDVPEYQSNASGVVQAAEGNLLLAGCTILFFSVIAYARFVYLQANGLIGVAGAEAGAKQKQATPGKARKSRAAGRQQEADRKSETADKPAASQKRTARKSVPTSDSSSGASTATAAQENGDSSLPRQNREHTGPAKKKKRADSGEARTGPKSTRGGKTAQSGSRKTDSASGDENDLGLSKSERRRKKKLKRREQRRAA